MQRAQDGAEIAGILDFVKIDRALTLPRRGWLSSGTTAAMPCGERVSLICAMCLDWMTCIGSALDQCA